MEALFLAVDRHYFFYNKKILFKYLC